jgi:hypothetical protein
MKLDLPELLFSRAKDLLTAGIDLISSSLSHSLLSLFSEPTKAVLFFFLLLFTVFLSRSIHPSVNQQGKLHPCQLFNR